MKNINDFLNKLAELRDESAKEEWTVVSHFLDLAIEEICEQLDTQDDKPFPINPDIIQQYFGEAALKAFHVSH